MIYIFLSTAALILVSVLLLGIKVFFTKGGQFPNTHIGGNPALRKKGIACAQTQDLQEQNRKDILELSNTK